MPRCFCVYSPCLESHGCQVDVIGLVSEFYIQKLQEGMEVILHPSQISSTVQNEFLLIYSLFVHEESLKLGLFATLTMFDLCGWK